MLRWRILLGAVFIALMVVILWLDHRAAHRGALLLPLIVGVSLAATGEYLRLVRIQGCAPVGWAAYVGSALVTLASGASIFFSAVSASPLALMGPVLVALVLAVILAIVAEMISFEATGKVIGQLAATLLGIVYSGLLLSFLLLLRLLPGKSGGDDGLLAVISLVVAVKCSDTGAYAVGRLIGRHKMAPRLSPGKTWEGAVGGLVFGCLGAWLVLGPAAVWWGLRPPGSAAPSGWIVYGLVLTAAGMLGDLAESLLKRDAGVKDSSAWLPGFGGVLDMVDSLALAAPVAFFIWSSGLIRW